MIGLQTYTIRSIMTDKESYESAMKKIRSIGYECVQLAGKADSLKMAADAARKAELKVIGVLGSIQDLDSSLSDIINICRECGAEDIGVSGSAKTEEEALVLADRINSYAKIIKAEGFSFSYHNHSHEFIRMDCGKTVMDILLEKFDFDYVDLMPDTYWLQHGGIDIRDFIEKHSEHIKILHLKDMKRTCDGVTFAELGVGNINMPGIVKLAQKHGFRHLIVEQDVCGDDPIASVKQSFEHLQDIMQGVNK